MFVVLELEPPSERAPITECLVNSAHVVAIRQRREAMGDGRCRLSVKVVLVTGEEITAGLGEHHSHGETSTRWREFCRALEAVDCS